jgi:hypothetical protein
MRASGPSTAPQGQRRCMQTTPAAGLSVEHMPAVLRRHCHSSPEAAPPRIRSLFAARASTTVERQTQAPQHTVRVSNRCAQQRIVLYKMLMLEACMNAQALPSFVLLLTKGLHPCCQW